MHRWVFHYEPRSRWGKPLHFMLHGVHHDYPNDASRLVMPPAVSGPLAFIFYGMFAILFGRFASPPSSRACSPVTFFTTRSIMRRIISR